MFKDSKESLRTDIQLRSIKRIIFESSNKFDGVRQKTLAIADIKQIGGRAGRYRSAHQQNESARASQQPLSAAKGELTPAVTAAGPAESNQPNTPAVGTDQVTDPTTPAAGPAQVRDSTTPAVGPAEVEDLTTPAVELAAVKDSTMGLVTTLEGYDFPIIRSAMKSEPEPIRTAGLFPPSAIVERFANYFPPGTPFSYMMMRLHELSQMHYRFHLCGLRDMLWLADIIEPVQGLTVVDRTILCACPASKSDRDLFRRLMPALGQCIVKQSGGSLFDIAELPLETLEEDISASREYLRKLESLHKGIVVYLWLSYRFAGVFNTRALAVHVKSLVEDKIEQVLSSFSFTEARRKAIAARKQSLLEQSLQEEEGQNPVEPVANSDEPEPSTVAGGDSFGGEQDESFADPVEEDAMSQTEDDITRQTEEDTTRQTEGDTMSQTVTNAGASASDIHADEILPGTAATDPVAEWPKIHTRNSTESDDARSMIDQDSTSVGSRADGNAGP